MPEGTVLFQQSRHSGQIYDNLLKNLVPSLDKLRGFTFLADTRSTFDKVEALPRAVCPFNVTGTSDTTQGQGWSHIMFSHAQSDSVSQDTPTGRDFDTWRLINCHYTTAIQRWKEDSLKVHCPPEWASIFVYVAAGLLWPDLPFLVCSPAYILGAHASLSELQALFASPGSLTCFSSVCSTFSPFSQ